MIDVKKPIRKAFYDCLSGVLLDPNSVIVGIYDDVQKIDDTTPLYVLLEGQSGTPQNNQTAFSSHEDIIISVVQKNSGRVAKSQVDYIAGQILNLVLPNPQSLGLAQQPGVQILDVQVAQDTYQTFFEENNNAVIRRMITFEMDTFQTNSGSTVDTGPSVPQFLWGMLKFTDADFSDSVTLPIPELSGFDLVVYLNGTRWLDEGPDFSILPSGGVTILIPGFDALLHNYTLYVTRKGN